MYRPRLRLLAIGTALLAPLAAASATPTTGPALSAAPAQAAGPDDLEDGAPESGPVVMLRVRSGATPGTIHWGRILGHDPEALRFQLLDTGGVARVPWGMVDPSQEHELRLKFGYVDTTDDVVLVQADRLVLRDGSEVIGKIIDRTETHVLMKTDRAIFPVPKLQIAGAATTVQVPATEIYTREELYSSELAQTDLEDPAAVFALAQYCERILDYAHAVEHYRAVAAAAPDHRPDDVAAAVTRTEARAQRQVEIDFLAEIEHLRKRSKYDEALAMVAAFPERFPDSPLLEDLLKRKQRVERSMVKDLEREVVRRWHYWAGKVARNMASPERTFEEVLAFADEAMSEEILQRVTRDMQRITREIQPQDVRALWEKREGGRWNRASYGMGTWLLGEDAALAGGPEEAAEEEPTGRAKERADFEEKIERWLKNQEAVRKSKRRADDGEDRQTFWATFGTASRYQWILAYYVENGGDMRVREKPEFQACRECGGTGVRQIVVAGGPANVGQQGQPAGGDRLIECEACHHIGIVRRVRYR